MDAGIHRIDMAAYIGDPCPVPSLSSGCAFKLISESPLHCFHAHPRLGGRVRDDSKASDLGTIVHDVLLGGEGKICEIDPADHPAEKTGNIPDGWTNKSIRAARDEARANGLTPILACDMIGVRAMVKAARAFIAGSEIAGIFDSGESELTVVSREGDTWLRTRPDWLSERFSLSFKTTRTKVHPDTFGRLADAMGYGFALAFYERCLRGITPGDVKMPRHLILAQEQLSPHACALFALAPAKAAIERSQVERAIKLWQKCMAEGEWPGYSKRVHHLEPKPWELAQEEARLVDEEMEAMETA